MSEYEAVADEMDPNWVKNAVGEEVPADVAGEMLRFMVLSVAKILSQHMVAEDIPDDKVTDYDAGANDCAVRVVDVIGAVMMGADPMEVQGMSVEEKLSIINSL